MKILLQTYSEDWPKQFLDEKKILENLIEKLTLIEHIGSTSVEGLLAKPIIDILIGVPDFSQADTYINPIENAGYNYISKYEDVMPYRRFFVKEKDGKRTHHIHLVEIESEFWKRHLFFRDYLRNHPEAKTAYANLKLKLAEQEWESGDSYASAKTEFIKAIEMKMK